MAHGQPDYGAYAPKETVGSMADNAELAARLGSIVTYDRRGDVVWYDDFESATLKWSSLGTDADADADISAAYARGGAFSCKITCGTGPTNRGGIQTYKPPPALSKVGLEVHWTRPLSDLVTVDFNLYVRHPSKDWDAGIRWVDATGTLEYWDGAAWQTIEAGLGGRASYYLFHPIKFVIDLENDLYHRLIFQNREWDLSAYPVATGGGGAIVETRIEVDSMGSGVLAPVYYVDDVILTQNEP